MTPTEHDLRWLELSAEVQGAQQKVVWAADAILHADGWRKSYDGWYWSKGDQRELRSAALPIAAESLATVERVRFYSGSGQEMVQRWIDAKFSLVAAQAELIKHDAKYTGWNRYFLVTSSNGLIHRDMYCSTCNKGRRNTEFALLPSLSGLEIAAAVAALGYSLCSVCWPEAPVEVVDGPKLPSRITSLLFEKDGQEKFTTELAKYQAKQAAKKGL